MANLRYVCFSDLHCGAPTSLLTPAATRSDAPPSGNPPSDAASLTSGFFAKALLATIAALKPAAPPDVILLGDVLDLSFGTPQSATAVFNTLLGNLLADGGAAALGRFLIVPGNHDHALWTAQRHQKYSLAVDPTAPPGTWNHSTDAFADPDQVAGSVLIDGILRAAGFDHQTSTYYPNLGLCSADGTRAVVLHHGHFVEAMYSLMSALLSRLVAGHGMASSVEELERVNGAWIDFFWSTIGDAGKFGDDVFLGYDYLLTGSETASFQHRLAGLLAKWLGQSLPLWRTKPMQQALALVANGLVDTAIGSFGQLQRFSYATVLSDDAVQGLKTYLDGPTWRQMLTELIPKEVPSEPNARQKTAELIAKMGKIDLTFVFGHTHKPFEDRLPSDRFQAPPAVYNTGGWILDTPMFATKEGASVVFIDEQMNVASLRLFGTPASDGLDPAGAEPVPVRVMTADGQDMAGNPMALALQAAVQATAPLWRDFSRAVDASYREKQAFIIDILHRRDAATDKRGSVL